ncbi:unnamed protein product [Lathyrus oleraceus]|uniref:Uncharacterized protein n=1 Tax=Pisum sativum TaxID=3888 RepID=A0A9D5A5N8_PEA|nr:uncharacterized protein LOC127097419 [Pisum sativum]KAI5398542.1 hypothetical protein KIW84_064064 [Pisum sativum]
MAYLLSTSFTAPLLINKELNGFDYALNKISKKTTVTSAQKIIGCNISNKCILFIEGRGSYQHCLMSSARVLYDRHSYKVNVNYCTMVVISGYWVGPDVDDGWGFVEAVIDQIT